MNFLKRLWYKLSGQEKRDREDVTNNKVFYKLLSVGYVVSLYCLKSTEAIADAAELRHWIMDEFLKLDIIESRYE